MDNRAIGPCVGMSNRGSGPYVDSDRHTDVARPCGPHACYTGAQKGLGVSCTALLERGSCVWLPHRTRRMLCASKQGTSWVDAAPCPA
jgi:hypothetical protein